MVGLRELTTKFRSVWPLLNERTRRLMAASEAKGLGHGGVTLVSRALRPLAQGHHEGHSRNRGRDAVGARADSAAGRRPQTDHGLRPTAAGGAGTADRAGYPRRPPVAAALDVQEYAGDRAGAGGCGSIRSTMRPSRSCCTTSTSACRAPARPKKARIIRTATRNSDCFPDI